MREVRNVYKILVGKPEWKTAVERPNQRCEDTTNMCFRETDGWNGFTAQHSYQ
jgi:hypothetical protein